MELNFTTIISIALASVLAYVGAITTVPQCCQQNNDYPKTVIGNDSISDNDDNDDNNDNNDNIGDNSSNIINSTNRNKLIKCKSQCDAQWKNDFYMHFQKNYDEEFYEFPLDELITASFDNFYTFCNLTKQKLTCWNVRCQINQKYIPWSSDLHICALKRLEFENALNCLNYTSDGAHNECNKICRRISRRFATKENEKLYLYGVSANFAEIYQYWQLNKQCAFQICHLECRKELIRNMCEENETNNGLNVIQDYYQFDLLDQLRSMIDSSTEHLYPLMCRLYLPIQYHLKLTNEISNEIKQSILAIKYAINGIVELITKL